MQVKHISLISFKFSHKNFKTNFKLYFEKFLQNKISLVIDFCIRYLENSISINLIEFYILLNDFCIFCSVIFLRFQTLFHKQRL